MTLPNTANMHKMRRYDAEITLTDIWRFLCNAKWFAMSGVILGYVIVSIYIAITPPVYSSKVTLEVLPPSRNALSINHISSDDLIDRLGFDKYRLEITRIMKISEDSPQRFAIDEALRSATPSKGGAFLNLSIKSDTPKNAQEIAQQLSEAIIAFINKINSSRLIHLQKSLAATKSKLTMNTAGVQKAEIQNRIIELEIAIDNASDFEPAIVNGPSFLPKPISPNKKSAILLAILLGAIFGCLSYYLIKHFIREKQSAI